MHFVKCNPSQDNAGTRTEWDSGLCSFAALRGMCCKLLFPHLLRPLSLSWAVPCACHFPELTSQAGIYLAPSPGALDAAVLHMQTFPAHLQSYFSRFPAAF